MATFSFWPTVYERVKNFDGEERGQPAQGAPWRIGGELVREGTAARGGGGIILIVALRGAEITAA